MKYLILLYALFSFNYHCVDKSPKNIIVSYTVRTSLINSDGNITEYGTPILASDKLYCEFLIRTKMELNQIYDTITDLTYQKEFSKDDTIGVKFVNLDKNNFFQIDRFANKYSVLFSGKFDTSQLGINFSSSAIKPVNKKGNYKFPTRDTIIENVKYLYTENRIKDSNGKDSAISKTYGLTQYKFKSPFSVLGVDDLGYGMVAGMSIELVGKPDRYSLLITQIKPASSSDRSLFDSIAKEFGW